VPRRKPPSASELLRIAKQAGIPSKYRRSRKKLLAAVENNPEVFNRKSKDVQKLFRREPELAQRYQSVVEEKLAEYIRKHPDISGTKILKNFRQSTGLSFKDTFGRELIRRERNLELDVSKIRRKKLNGKQLMIYGREDAPVGENYPFAVLKGEKGRFYYLVHFEALTNEQPDYFDQYAWFIEDDPMDNPFEWAVEQLQERLRQSSGLQGSRYKISSVDMAKVEVAFVVDTDRKTVNVPYFHYIKNFT